MSSWTGLDKHCHAVVSDHPVATVGEDKQIEDWSFSVGITVYLKSG